METITYQFSLNSSVGTFTMVSSVPSGVTSNNYIESDCSTIVYTGSDPFFTMETGILLTTPEELEILNTTVAALFDMVCIEDSSNQLPFTISYIAFQSFVYQDLAFTQLFSHATYLPAIQKLQVSNVPANYSGQSISL